MLLFALFCTLMLQFNVATVLLLHFVYLLVSWCIYTTVFPSEGAVSALCVRVYVAGLTKTLLNVENLEPKG